jgi:hypothetical protein
MEAFEVYGNRRKDKVEISCQWRGRLVGDGGGGGGGGGLVVEKKVVEWEG